jgi:osmotically inducible protein OsmC
MPIRTGQADWHGNLKEGNGTLRTGSGAYEGPYSFMSRFEEGAGTNPEELVAAAHAGCYSMALSNGLDQAGFTPRRVSTKASAHLTKGDDGFAVRRIELDVEAEVPNIDEARFVEIAEKTKTACPISKLLTGAEITLSVKLLSSSTA